MWKYPFKALEDYRSRRWEDAVVSTMLCCSTARAVAGVAFVIFVTIVLEALPHLVDIFVS
jgi:hypothetical protein